MKINFNFEMYRNKKNTTIFFKLAVWLIAENWEIADVWLYIALYTCKP